MQKDWLFVLDNAVCDLRVAAVILSGDKILLQKEQNGEEYALPGGHVHIGETLQDALEAVFGTRCPVTGCSRTDAGVHAKGFVCKAEGVPDGIPVSRIPEALGTKLPHDIAVTAAWTVSDDFHPRYDAKGKRYCYYIRNARVRDPFTCETSALWQKPIDVTACNAICTQLVGTHDFRSFMASGSDIVDTVRTVTEFTCRREGETVIFSVAADGFLYNMVRILVGTVLDLHDGALKASAQDILNAHDRTQAGRTMPASGLCLEEVFYD